MDPQRTAGIGLFVFAFGVGSLVLVALLFIVLDIAAQTAASLTAGPLGVSVSIAALRRGSK